MRNYKFRIAGNYLTTQGRLKIEQKNIKTKAIVQSVNEEIKKAPIKTVSGGVTNKVKKE